MRFWGYVVDPGQEIDVGCEAFVSGERSCVAGMVCSHVASGKQGPMLVQGTVRARGGARVSRDAATPLPGGAHAAAAVPVLWVHSQSAGRWLGGEPTRSLASSCWFLMFVVVEAGNGSRYAAAMCCQWRLKGIPRAFVLKA